jgi:hypothetical protein
MKSIQLFIYSLLLSTVGYSQLLSWTPSFPVDNDNVSITVDATLGNLGLQGFTGTVYVHTGVITNASTGPSDWRYSKLLGQQLPWRQEPLM